MEVPKPHGWCLNNFLLESPVLKIKDFFPGINLYRNGAGCIQGIFISFKTVRDKMQGLTRMVMMTTIQKLENENKNWVSLGLKVAYENFKLIDAYSKARDNVCQTKGI